MSASDTEYFRELRWILGDQLNSDHSWYATVQPDVLYVIAELRQETDYARHHAQKICAFFAAMAQFAGLLRSRGHNVLHLTLDDTAAFENLPALVQHLAERHQIEIFSYQRPDEWRLLQQFRSLKLPDGVSSQELDSEHFLLPFEDIARHFPAGKSVRMEGFYRRMRRRFDLLMEAGEPVGGRWNYDSENRRKLQASDLAEIPAPLLFANDVSPILARLERHQVASLGAAPASLPWPVNREQALPLLAFFCRHCLPRFGHFQDAMTCNHEHAWSLYHSRLSFALNSKLLHPGEVLAAALDRWRQQPGLISLAQIEGFVRQVLGWREYIRGMYWANMPAYQDYNHLEAGRDLPGYFWTGETRMNCLRAAIGQSLEHAYAHHIQRLMVTGNFCMLAGIDPAQVDQWYLGIYIDAVEWVELPNTRGMSQFADGGLVASKPYAASGNYVNKMSDYCKPCHYRVAEKTGERACPLNSLYWHFMARQRQRLQTNPRIGMAYRSWDRMAPARQQEILDQGEAVLARLEAL